MAGLVATSIWQYRQSQTAAEQARSEQAIARTKADNDWRIARAEILSKNLNVLSTQGPGSADQRFGVLLSLTRGAIIDPELAVSYALELGKDNPSYMRAVLEATGREELRAARAGVQADLPAALRRREGGRDLQGRRARRSAPTRSRRCLQDELEATAAVAGAAGSGPLSILRDEREVQAFPGRMAWLFEPYLQDLYERRQSGRRSSASRTSRPGARLVAALVLATARTGELVSSSEATALEKFHADHRKWLASYLLGKSCDADCRGKLVDVMLSSYGEAEGDYDEPLRRLLHAAARRGGARRSRHLHARLLWCQVDADDLARSSAIACWCRRSTEALPDPTKPRPEDGGRSARGSGRPGRAGARAAGRPTRRRRDAWKKLIGRRSSTAPTSLARALQRAPRGLGARARQPAADDQEGELLQRRGAPRSRPPGTETQ